MMTKPRHIAGTLVMLLLILMCMLAFALATSDAGAQGWSPMEPRWVCQTWACWARLTDAPDIWTAVLWNTKIAAWRVVELWEQERDWRYETAQ